LALDRPLVVSADPLPPQPTVASIQPELPLRWSLTTTGWLIVEIGAVIVRPWPVGRSDALSMRDGGVVDRRPVDTVPDCRRS
jgi:hypothetical protein